MKSIYNIIATWNSYKDRLKAKNKAAFFIVDIVETLIVAFALFIVLRTFVVQTSRVYSGSMIPTMQIGDRLFVNKMVYHFRNPHRGEIILFKSPKHDGKEYVKRLIALPGEEVKIERGVIYINGKEVNFPGVNVQVDYSFYGPQVIPANSYFAMGDNRPNSYDSRMWGFVPKKDLIGRAVFTFWPLDRMQLLK